MHKINMWLKILIVIFSSQICVGQLVSDNLSLNVHKVKPPYYHHYYDPYHGLLYGGGILSYLTFLAVKVKIVFIIGAIFTFFLFAGKLYALIKFSEYMLYKKHHHHEHEYEAEKIYVPSNHDSHDYSGFSGPNVHSSPTFDLPPSMYASEKRYRIRRPSRIGDGGRSLNKNAVTEKPESNSSNIIYEVYEKIRKLMTRVNITDIILNEMDIQGRDCRKRFMCELNFYSDGNAILKTGINILRDKQFIKYQPKTNITRIEDCKNLYRKCKGKQSKPE